MRCNDMIKNHTTQGKNHHTTQMVPSVSSLLQLGNQCSLRIIQCESKGSTYPIQRMTDDDLQSIVDEVMQFFGFSISEEQVVEILSNAYKTSGQYFTRNWLQRVDYKWARDVVIATISGTPRAEEHVLTFGDKDLQDGERALGKGKIPHSTYLESGSDIEARRQHIISSGGSVDGDVMIHSNGITCGTGVEQQPFSMDFPPEATESVFSHPWTHGWATNPKTREEVGDLTRNYGEQMVESKLAKVTMTGKWYQKKQKDFVAAPHRKAYTTNHDDLFLINAERTDPTMTHSKTNKGVSTVHPGRESVTFHYGYFATLFAPLIEQAYLYLYFQTGDNEATFIERLQHDTTSAHFPADLRKALLEVREDLNEVARRILYYKPSPKPNTKIMPFGSYDPRPDDDSAYRKQGVKHPFHFL